MGSVCSWNIHGLNWPNKQEDLKVFLHTYNADFIGLIESNVKVAKVDSIVNNLLMGWHWLTDFDAGDNGEIWVAWKPSRFTVTLVSKTAQTLHC